MLRTAILISIALMSLTCSAQSKRAAKPAAPTSSPEQQIKALEQRWLDALIKRDQATVGDILAPEFHDTGIDGKVHTREQALAAVLDTTRPDLTRFFGRLEVNVYDGRFAVAHGLTVLNGEKIREAHVSFTDVFVLRDGKWLAVAAQETLAEE